MRTEFYHPFKLRKEVTEMDPEKLRTKIKNIIRPRYNDEWFDPKTHYKEAAHEVMRLLFEHKPALDELSK